MESFEVLDKERRVVGRFAISNYKLEREHPFHQFVAAGLELNVTMAIDFSASIRNACHQDSPHHTGKGSSQYLEALLALSSFVLDYACNQRASVFAVGAKAKHPKVYTGEKVQQCFPLSGDFDNPLLEGAEAIKAAYLSLLSHLEFSGPTDFTEVIRRAMFQCLEGKRRKEEFSVLVILCDGKLTNKPELKKVLEECATLPIYIVFMAVGNDCSDLTDLSAVKMEVYTGDKCLAERENMINVASYLKGQDLAEIARNAFKYLPHVVSRYMSLRKRTPASLEKVISKKLTDSRMSSSQISVNPEI